MSEISLPFTKRAQNLCRIGVLEEMEFPVEGLGTLPDPLVFLDLPPESPVVGPAARSRMLEQKSPQAVRGIQLGFVGTEDLREGGLTGRTRFHRAEHDIPL